MPYGVRVLSGGGNFGDLDLIFVAAADLPSDARNQFVYVLSGAALGARYRDGGGDGDGARGGGDVDPCVPVETLRVDATDCVTPHELGVDRSSGDVYLACVTANASLGSTRGLLRYRLVSPATAAGSSAGAGATKI